MSRTIACVGHDGYRAGAQLALLDTVRWLRLRHGADLVILLVKGGPLVGDYAVVAPTVVVGVQDSAGPPAADSARTVRAARLDRLRRLTPNGVDLVYTNTVASVRVVRELKAMWQCPVLCHVRELEMGIRQHCGVEVFHAAQPFIDAYLASTAGVEANLVRNHGVPKSCIHRIPVGISVARQGLHALGADGTHLRRQLGIPPDAFIVGGAGTTDWRKGSDLFVQVARQVVARGGQPPIHFVWVGGGGMELEYLRRDTTKLGLDGRLHWVGSIRDPRGHFSMFGAFLLTSREDPFPLVCLEAAALQVPTICFRDAGGIPEFVEDDAGFVVPYLDVEAAASNVLALARDPGLRMRLGSRAGEKVRARHDIEQFGARLVRIFEQYLAG